MFSLIIVIISVVLVSALALATIYYGKDIAVGGQARAGIAKILQEGNQVAGALELYKADNGGFPEGTSDEIKELLTSKNYLKSLPSGEWTFITDYAVRTDLSEDTCLTINQRVGLNLVPRCSDPAYASRSICCSTEEGATP